MFKAFFTQEYLDALSPDDREMMEALMAADTDEKLKGVVKRLCTEAEKEAMEALDKPKSSKHRIRFFGIRPTGRNPRDCFQGRHAAGRGRPGSFTSWRGV